MLSTRFVTLRAPVEIYRKQNICGKYEYEQWKKIIKNKNVLFNIHKLHQTKLLKIMSLEKKTIMLCLGVWRGRKGRVLQGEKYRRKWRNLSHFFEREFVQRMIN